MQLWGRPRAWRQWWAAIMCGLVWPALRTGAVARAQSVTTAAIHGTVRVVRGGSVDADTAAGLAGAGARVTVTNTATGFASDVAVRGTQFLVPGLEIGGPYVVTVRRIGFAPQKRADIYLELGQRLELGFLLQPNALVLDTMTTADDATDHREARNGMTISDSLIRRLPTLNRDLYDFAKLAPQVSAKTGLPGVSGLSGGGANFRFNNFLIDGAPDQFSTGNSSYAANGGKSVSIEAVKEFQVLLTPFDVRYGGFAGALVNTVTKAGTKALHGSAFVYTRNDHLSRQSTGSSSAPYDRQQYGFSLSGPLLRDYVNFFIAPELQRLAAPARGPFIGQPSSISPAAPISAADAARFAGILRGFGLDAGSAGAVTVGNPLSNLFARMDVALPTWHTTIVATENYGGNRSQIFSRAVRDTFAFSSFRVTQTFASALSSLQIRSMLAHGAYNELVASYRPTWSEPVPDGRQPIIQVLAPSLDGTTEVLESGTSAQAQAGGQHSSTAQLSDNVTLPIGATHAATVGAEVRFVRISGVGIADGYGTWAFSSLDSLSRGLADRYQRRLNLGSAGASFGATQAAVYGSDQWRPSERLSVTVGLRADALLVGSRAPYNSDVYVLFKRRTDAVPSRRVQFSPRVGFDWDVSGSDETRLRGGAGVFTGREPLSWLQSAVASYGVGIGSLRCGSRPLDIGPAPHFEPNYQAAPAACANGHGLAGAPRGDVDLVADRLQLPRTFRASLALERRLPANLIATIEGLFSRTISDFAFVNLNLQGPQGTDANGRVLYGTINAVGVASPVQMSNFAEVIDLRNTSSGHAYVASARLERPFTQRFAGSASYSYSHVRDAETPLRAGLSGLVTWAGARAVSGRHDEFGAGISTNDVPHRVTITGTYAAPWTRRTTDLSFYYIGESGSPLTYVAWGTGGRGDLNADGAVGNDPVYIPLNALDSTEIRFSGQSDAAGADTSSAGRSARVAGQQMGLERFITGNPCLARQRGRIMERNSCRMPFTHTTIASIRQSLFAGGGGQSLSAQLDVFNVLNLLHAAWGLYRTSDGALLEQVGQTPGSGSGSQPIFRFDATRARWVTLPVESAYQLQLSLRYRF